MLEETAVVDEDGAHGLKPAILRLSSLWEEYKEMRRNPNKIYKNEGSL